jgi:hypothetical protein
MIDDLIAICGVSCTQCHAYSATHANSKLELQKVADEWTKALGHLFSVNDVTCDGCRIPNGRLSSYCQMCEIRKCARNKGIATCAHCTECPCEKIVAPIAQEALAVLKKSLRDNGGNKK